MMDTIFRDLILTDEVIVYMDDILIATSHDPLHHREVVHQVLYRLEEHNLYLKPEKCSFETQEVKYLGVIFFFIFFFFGNIYIPEQYVSTKPVPHRADYSVWKPIGGSPITTLN